MSSEVIHLRDKHGTSGAIVEGESVRALGRFLVDGKVLPDNEAFGALKASSLGIIEQCKPFNASDGIRTGIIVGYVQSGKTLSMTAVAALAKDNGCRIVIVLAGTKTNLLKQSRDRFRRDLRGGGARNEDWTMLDSVETLDPGRDGTLLSSHVQEWRDATIPERLKKPLFVTVMKQHQHLARLSNLLRAADLRGIPALIIDDEADQAGLNTTPDSPTPSTTYRSIREVRRCLPNHTYLQYTATPQAPLLISLVDILSPEFVEVLEPGQGYTGGLTFFADRNPYVRRIPFDDLFEPGSPPSEPPESMLEALRLFVVGVAVAVLRNESGPRSMLIHPSRSTSDHAQFIRFVNAARSEWQSVLSREGDPDREDILEQFRAAYDDIARADHNLPPFDAGFVQTLRIFLGRVIVSEVNSNDGRELDWDNAFAHVLVGGEKLNRGYTVEGLTVTWMPRDAGGWNADTIQQRARFFGYKQGYLPLCRIFLHPDVHQAYQDYVTHEEDVRGQLRDHRGHPLRDWMRAFFLDARLRPTRHNVLSDPYYRSVRVDWFRQNQPHVDIEALASNRDLVDKVRQRLPFEQDSDYPQHQVATASLNDVFQSLLVDYRVNGTSDVVQFFSTRCWIRDLLDENPEAECLVINMSSGKTRNRSEDQRRPPNINIHEGRRASGKGYPGDRALRDNTRVAVQLHRVRIETTEGKSVDDVPAIAVFVPNELRNEDVVIQKAG